MSLDGYIDDASERRLVLSGEADLDRVDELRANCDAILVGAGTIRADDPRLVLRSAARRDARVAAGLPPDPVKVTMTGSGDLEPAARFFTVGSAARIVYAASGAVASATRRLAGLAVVADAGEPVSLRHVLADLAGRRVRRLLVEGGSSVQAQFLAAGLADELQLVVAPFFIGDPRAPRFAEGRGGAGAETRSRPDADTRSRPDAETGSRTGTGTETRSRTGAETRSGTGAETRSETGAGAFPWTAESPARLAEVRRVGNDVLLRYALSGRFDAGTGSGARDRGGSSGL